MNSQGTISHIWASHMTPPPAPSIQGRFREVHWNNIKGGGGQSNYAYTYLISLFIYIIYYISTYIYPSFSDYLSKYSETIHLLNSLSKTLGLSIYLFIYESSIYLSMYLSSYLSLYVSIYLSETIHPSILVEKPAGTLNYLEEASILHDHQILRKPEEKSLAPPPF